jgi:hypothetical protein
MSIGQTILVGALLFVNPPALAAETRVNGFPTDAGFFPIGVWLQSPVRAARYKAIGINTFVGLYQGPTEEQLAALAKYDMFTIADQNDVALNSVNGHIMKGWLHGDEPDNAQPIGFGRYGTCIPANEVVRQTRDMKARDPTRPVMINFGQGVASDFWQGRGPCTGDHDYYSIALQGADILSFDIYPIGSSIPQVKGKLEYVARGVTNLVNRIDDMQSVWSAIETTALDPTHPPLAAQVRAEVWMALIHGARGIFYFAHEFAPKFREDAIFAHRDIVEEVVRTNALIKLLAPVLNSPSVPQRVNVRSNAPIDIMVKLQEHSVYIFAVSMRNVLSRPEFKVAAVGDTQAQVIGEQRNIAITGGTFEDLFEGYDVHLYRIPY